MGNSKEWIIERLSGEEAGFSGFRRRFVCPYCGVFNTYGKTPFCPWCGEAVKHTGN